MTKGKKWLLCVFFTLMTAGLTVILFGFGLPYRNAGSTMPEGGELVIFQEEDNALHLYWPQAEGTEEYCLEFLRPGQTDREVLYRDFIQESTDCYLPQLPEGMMLTLRVSPVVRFRTVVGEQIRQGENSLEVTAVFDPPAIGNLRWDTDPESLTVNASFAMEAGDRCVCTLAGETEPLAVLEEGALTLSFGEGKPLPVLEYGDSCRVLFSVQREVPGLRYYGAVSGEMNLTREDFLGRELSLTWEERDNGVHVLSWNETKGERYAVQILDPDQNAWVTVRELPGSVERRCAIPRGTPYQELRCRVAAVGGQADDSGYAAISQELRYLPEESPVYATVWPTKRLTAYTDPQGSFASGSVETGKALCVLAEENGMFAVRLGGEIRYIDSCYCMINLPEYLGALCRYEITNASASHYMVHGYEIPNVTNEVTPGYENIRLADGSYLVPLLYPTAQRLAAAAKEALSQGYRLKIYDSFRPHRATTDIYWRTEIILEDPLPDQGGNGPWRTYKSLMTGGSFGLNAFLARSWSRHNYGTALDLTLEEKNSGQELTMQTAMHDLSHYAARNRNNDNAEILSDIMTGAGFGTLVSEWWHYQDDDIHAELEVAGVEEGVSAEGWVNDGVGWKYRTAAGKFLTGGTHTVEGSAYTFDEYGYAE